MSANPWCPDPVGCQQVGCVEKCLPGFAAGRAAGLREAATIAAEAHHDDGPLLDAYLDGSDFHDGYLAAQGMAEELIRARAEEVSRG